MARRKEIIVVESELDIDAVRELASGRRAFDLCICNANPFRPCICDANPFRIRFGKKEAQSVR